MHLREKCLAGCRMRYGVVFFEPDRQLVRVTLHGKIHSRDRDSRISFDIVVEVSRKGASGPYLYWLWECKDYTRPVQVNQSLGAQVPKGRWSLDIFRGTQSRRDYITQPRVARHELPWVCDGQTDQP